MPTGRAGVCADHACTRFTAETRTHRPPGPGQWDVLLCNAFDGEWRTESEHSRGAGASRAAVTARFRPLRTTRDSGTAGIPCVRRQRCGDRGRQPPVPCQFADGRQAAGPNDNDRGDPSCAVPIERVGAFARRRQGHRHGVPWPLDAGPPIGRHPHRQRGCHLRRVSADWSSPATVKAV